MATANIVCEIAGLEDLITASKAFLMMTNKADAALTYGTADDEIATYYNGATYSASATFTGTVTGKQLVMVHDSSTVEIIRIWTSSTIPTGSKITACAKYLEDPADDADSADNATGTTKSYYKYTFTY